MALFQLTQHNSHFSTCGQITPEQLLEIATLGYTTIINNRPDGEEPPHKQATSQDIEKAAIAAGLAYFYIPVTGETMTDTQISKMREVIQNAPGPVFAYCRTGNRSTIMFRLTGL